VTRHDPRLSRFGNERVEQLAAERAGGASDRRDSPIAEDYAALGTFGILLALFVWFVELPWFFIPTAMGTIFCILGLLSLSVSAWMLTDDR